MTIATKENLFNPAKLSPRDKAAITDTTARAIIASEAAQRESKTEKLRRLRLEREATEEPKSPTPRRKPLNRARAHSL